jgi:hypothetical protein
MGNIRHPHTLGSTGTRVRRFRACLAHAVLSDAVTMQRTRWPRTLTAIEAGAVQPAATTHS